MKQEEEKLLLKDLCSRLPYGVKVVAVDSNGETISRVYTLHTLDADDFISNSEEAIIPYLRPLSSMTEEEKKEYESLCILIPVNYDSDLSKYDYYTTDSIDSFDWLNAHHFDFHNLIERGLALEAHADMYNSKKK